MRSEVGFRSDKTVCVVFLKDDGIIEAARPIAEQVYSLVLNESQLYDTLLRLVGKVVTPVFKSYVKESSKGEQTVGDKLAPTVEKSLDEVEIGLIHMQQKIEIPEIDLVVHPKIQQIIDNAEAQDRKPQYEDLGDIATNSEFLNELQKCVNNWIQEIQKVTMMDRDAGSGKFFVICKDIY